MCLYLLSSISIGSDRIGSLTIMREERMGRKAIVVLQDVLFSEVYIGGIGNRGI